MFEYKKKQNKVKNPISLILAILRRKCQQKEFYEEQNKISKFIQYNGKTELLSSNGRFAKTSIGPN